MVQTHNDEEKGMHLEKTNHSSFILFQCISFSPAWQFCTNNYFINFSLAKCTSWVFSRFTSLLLTSCSNCSGAFIQKSDTLVTSTYILPLTIIFTHLLISSRYSLHRKHFDNFAFDSDTNSVTNRNPRLELKLLPPQNRILIPFRKAFAMDRTKPLFKSFF